MVKNSPEHVAVLQAGRAAAQARKEAERAKRIGEGVFECAKCRNPFPLEGFPKGRARRDGSPRYAYCKTCHSEYQRAQRFRTFFHITVEEYEKILALQGGVCAICKLPPKKMRLAVDHDHKTGLIRGLLCSICNRAIARFRDDLERFKACVEYFTTPPATRALGEPRYGLKGRVSNKAATRARLNKV